MLTAYIETTVASYYAARPSTNLIIAARQAMTRLWWDSGCSDFELFTSLETLNESSMGDPKVASRRLTLLESIPLLSLTPEVDDLAAGLVEAGLVPSKAASDAVHIAVASVHNIDYLLTWNFKHIANRFAQQKLATFVAAAGYHLPILCSPEDLYESDPTSE